MDWYKRDIGAYRRATSRLKPLAHGVYSLLLDEYYAGQGPLPDDLTALYRICGAQTEGEKIAVRTIIDQYFPKNGDGYRHNERADDEIAAYRGRKAVNTINSRSRFDHRLDHPNDHRTDHPQTHPFDHRKKETNIERKNDVCHILVNGKPCGEPAAYWTKQGTNPTCKTHGLP